MSHSLPLVSFYRLQLHASKQWTLESQSFPHGKERSHPGRHSHNGISTSLKKQSVPLPRDSCFYNRNMVFLPPCHSSSLSHALLLLQSKLIPFTISGGFPRRWRSGLTLAGCQVPTKATPSLPLLSWTGETKNRTKGSWVDTRTGRSLGSYRHGQNRLDLGRKKNLLPVKSRVG